MTYAFSEMVFLPLNKKKADNWLCGALVFHRGEGGYLSYLNHLGVEALSQLTATMNHHDRAIKVDMD